MLISTPGTVAAVAAFNLGETPEASGGGPAWSSHESSHFGAQGSGLGGFAVGGLRDSLLGLSAGDSFASRGIDAAAGLTPVEQGELARQADEIVVTARAGPVTDADIAAYDAEQAGYALVDASTIERPIDIRSFNSANDLRAAELVFEQRQAETGRLPGDEAIEAGFDAEYARLDARAAVADRLTLDAVKSVLPPVDTAVAAYRLGVNGEYTLENGLTLGGAALGGLGAVGGKLVSGIGGDVLSDVPKVLYHYTDEAGVRGITESNRLNPSLWQLGTKDVRYGNGQYVSDIVPGTRTPSELSRDFLGQPFQGNRFSHYVEIDATGLGAIQGRSGVYVIPNDTPLDLSDRLISSGALPIK